MTLAELRFRLRVTEAVGRHEFVRAVVVFGPGGELNMTEHDGNPLKEQIAAEARLVYQNFIDFIRDLKRQQWSVTYYALAIYGVIIALHRILSDDNGVDTIETWALTTFAIMTFVLASYFTWANVRSLTKARRHVTSIRREFFTTEVQKNLDRIDPPKSSYEKWWYDLPVLLPLILVTAIGFISVLWIVVLRA